MEEKKGLRMGTGMPAFLLLTLACGALAAGPKAPAFRARRDYVTSYSVAGGMVLARTTSSGFLDIIQPDVEVLFGNGNGTFRPGPQSDIGCGSGPLVASDLDGDGKIDLALPNKNGVCVSIGNGDGTFQNGVFYAAGTDTLTDTVVVGDFNSDGIPDVATVGQHGIWLFTGKGGGVLNPGVLTPFMGASVDRAPPFLAAGDINGDGNLDLVALTTTGFAIFLGTGTGTFQAPTLVTTPAAPGWMAVGDVNLDGRADVLITSNSSAYVSLYMGASAGGVTGPTFVYLPGSSQIAVGDVNGDGIPDLVNSTVYVALGKGNGKFNEPTFYAAQTFFGPYNVALGELRNDGRNDIVVQGSAWALSVLLNTGKGAFQDGEWTPVTGGAGCGAVADYNRDGKPDLAVNTPSGITLLFGTGKASSPFTTGSTIAVPGPGCVITGDLNGDGIADLLVESFLTGSGYFVDAYLGKGDGTFTLASSTAVSTPGYLALGDFNHDGKLDFASSGNLLALGNGDGTFQTPMPITSSPPLNGFSNIAVGDLISNGWSDILLTNASLGVYELLNNKHGAFSQTIISVPKSAPSQVVLADLDNDGILDFVVGSSTGSPTVYVGNGKGGFTQGVELVDYLQGLPGVVAVADVNGDGIPDIVLDEGSSVAIFLGTGNAQYKTPFYIGAGPSPGSIYTENLHGQSPTAGLPDIVAPDASGGVTVLINTTK